MVLDSTAAEAGLLSNTVLPPGEAYRHLDQCGVCPSVGAAGWGTGGAGTQCFSLQEGLSNLHYMTLKYNVGNKHQAGAASDISFTEWFKYWTAMTKPQKTLYVISQFDITAVNFKCLKQ